jgi:hypothetical protein
LVALPDTFTPWLALQHALQPASVWGHTVATVQRTPWAPGNVSIRSSQLLKILGRVGAELRFIRFTRFRPEIH